LFIGQKCLRPKWASFSAGQSCNTVEYAAGPRKAGRFNQAAFLTRQFRNIFGTRQNGEQKSPFQGFSAVFF
jgi:hypothetical protein